VLFRSAVKEIWLKVILEVIFKITKNLLLDATLYVDIDE